MSTSRFFGFSGRRHHRAHSRQRGINLIELMIAMVLGLLVVGGAVSIFVTNQQTYAATESLGRIQENTRTAFELMARELREAGGNPCGRNLQSPLNQLPNANATWWSTWRRADVGDINGLQVYDDGEAFTRAPLPPAAGAGSRIAGTDAIEALSAAGGTFSFWVNGPTLVLNDGAQAFASGDVLLACDYLDAVLFTAASAAGTPQVISPAPPIFSPTSFGTVVARLAASRWYIGDTGRVNANTGQPLLALFRSTLRQGVVVNEEVAEGVINMQITHLNGGAYVVGPTDWRDTQALNITLTLAGRAQGETGVSTNAPAGVLGGFQRQVNYVVQLRNRSQ